MDFQLPELQFARIRAIALNDISGLSVPDYPPAFISNLPCLIILDDGWTPTRISQTEFNFEFVWDLHLYLSELGDGLELVNGVNARSYLGKFVNAFMSRRYLQLNDNGLAWVKETQLSLVNGLSKPKAYPPRSGTPNYWGSQYRLTVTVQNYVLQSA
jgi:hypothetical protein